MSHAARLRDSTQIQLPARTFESVASEVQGRFAVTVSREECAVRIIGSPVVIKDVGEYLARNGITVD